MTPLLVTVLACPPLPQLTCMPSARCSRPSSVTPVRKVADELVPAVRSTPLPMLRSVPPSTSGPSQTTEPSAASTTPPVLSSRASMRRRPVFSARIRPWLTSERGRAAVLFRPVSHSSPGASASTVPRLVRSSALALFVPLMLPRKPTMPVPRKVWPVSMTSCGGALEPKTWPRP